MQIVNNNIESSSQFLLEYQLYKSNAECWPPLTYGLRRQSGKTQEECISQARKLGVDMFVSCKNSMFHCYTYSKKNSHGTCTTKANPNNCNVFTKAKPAMSQQSKLPLQHMLLINFDVLRDDLQI